MSELQDDMPVRSSLRYRLRRFNVYLPVVVVFLVFAVFEPVMFSPGNIRNISIQASYLIIFTTAQSLVLLTRGFDLSIGMGVSLVSVVAALAMKGIDPSAPMMAITFGICVGLLVGAVIGMANGVLVSFAGINPFVVTLGTSNILLALDSTISGGFPVAPLPAELTKGLAEGSVLGIPVPILVAGVVLVGTHLFLKRTVLGRGLYLIGSNPRAATVAGIHVRFYLFLVYVICAVLAAVGAILLTARTGSGEPNLGGSLGLQTIAAAVIGGVRLRGGEGSAMSALLGGLLVTIMSNGMDLARIDGYLQQVCFGLIIVVSLIFDRFDNWNRRS